MFVIISSSPNADGLTAACAAAALTGVCNSGGESMFFDLCQMDLESCRQCGNGWGKCRSEHSCIIDDDLSHLQDALKAAQGVVIISPVYYGELSESAKAAFDRLRRCEATKGDLSALAGKPAIMVAAAGGSGGGITTCLSSMERLAQHMKAQVQDLIGITQRSRSYRVDDIRAAVAKMVINSKAAKENA